MNPIKILLIEDNEGDILLTLEAFEEGKIFNTIQVIRDGESAIDYLEKRNDFVRASRPDLILLDVNLPKKNGHEVLKYIKQTEHLKSIPVIMLTTSSSQVDIDSAYKNYANCYITKPVEVSDFIEAVGKIEDFWINIVQLPTNS
ncbi:response regulator [Litoribacter ruber]|uniref:Response regulator n=1 Tax=Litoribacter ruber TaxID=702568 RepID=A0AAP2G4I7_9BACT|nr:MULTISPECIES: response regulator [Litoribacter]MBS9524540.1 response regulator [Litoribacter alkaliphilus]MBT0810300.1 response regulator [Litoribacter ruber]